MKLIVFALLMSTFRSFCSWAGSRMDIFKREIAIDKFRLAGLDVLLIELRQRIGVESFTERALEIAEFDDCNRRIFIAFDSIIICADINFFKLLCISTSWS